MTCRPTSCNGCGALLPPEGQRLIGRSQVEELPRLRTVVIELLRYAVIRSSDWGPDGGGAAGLVRAASDVRAASGGPPEADWRTCTRPTT